MKKFIGNLDLKPKQDNWQSVYNSQLYGTFFGVYAKIESEETGNKDVRKITSMTLEVVNYKGELDLGIEDATYIPNGETDLTGGKIFLTVRAMVNNIIDPNSKEVKTQEVSVNGIAGMLFKNGEATIHIKRYLKPIHSEKSESEMPLKEGVFDSEFHYREGKVFEGYTLKPESRTIGGRPTEPETEFIQMSGHAVSGIFCPFAELLLFWIG